MLNKKIIFNSKITSLSFLKKNLKKKYRVMGFIKSVVTKKYLINVKKLLIITFIISKFLKFRKKIII